MKILVIEDETPASTRLIKMIQEIEPKAQIVSTIVSVASGIKWLIENDNPDLIFSDIQLSDGLSFEIFKKINVTSPVIFTTAFDQYAIEAFKLNSVDYLLKPVKKEELHQAFAKYKKLHVKTSSIDISKLMKTLQAEKTEYKKRFIVRYGEHIKTINSEEVAYFYTEDKVNFLVTNEGRRFAIDFNLDTLENSLNPKIFFRINRQYIIGIHAIKEMFAYSKSRVLVKLTPESKHETVVSTERSGDFKLWLGDEK